MIKTHIISKLKRIADTILCTRYTLPVLSYDKIPNEPTIGLALTVIGSRGFYSRLNTEHKHESSTNKLSFYPFFIRKSDSH